MVIVAADVYKLRITAIAVDKVLVVETGFDQTVFKGIVERNLTVVVNVYLFVGSEVAINNAVDKRSLSLHRDFIQVGRVAEV